MMASLSSRYEYRVVNVARVIDGDTFDLDLDLGFYVILRVRVRLYGADTYELYGINASSKGREAQTFTDLWLRSALDSELLVARTFKLNPDSPVADGAFGRWAAEIVNADGDSLAVALDEAGFIEHEGTS